MLLPVARIAMPTVLREGGFRFFFHSNEAGEPPHVHAAKAECRAKYWLRPEVELVWSHGFRRNELSAIKKIVTDARERLEEAWNEHFDRA